MLSKTYEIKPETPALLDDARKVPADSPAFATASFARLRLEAATKPDESATEIDRLLKGEKDTLPPSATNLFRGLRLTLAKNLDEFARFVSRTPSSVQEGLDGQEMYLNSPEFFGKGPERTSEEVARDSTPDFDWDGAQILNRKMPLGVLLQVAESQELPQALRVEVARSGWTRAVLLEDSSADSFAEILARDDKDLRGAMEDFRNAKTPEEKHDSALLALLRNPGLRPYVTIGLLREGVARTDSFHDNWWCAHVSIGPRDQVGGIGPEAPAEDPLLAIYPDRHVRAPRFLSAGDGDAANRESGKLQNIEAAPDYLARETLAWAKAQPDDSRVTEALYRVVRATRYGCTDESTSKLSRAAFDYLHKNYPKDPWTAKTKYWY